MVLQRNNGTTKDTTPVDIPKVLEMYPYLTSHAKTQVCPGWENNEDEDDFAHLPDLPDTATEEEVVSLQQAIRLSMGDTGDTATAGPSATAKPVRVPYHFTGCIVHKGSVADCGHYVAYTRM